MIRDLERVQADLHRQTGAVAGHLRMASFSTAMRGLVAPVARELLDTHPDLTIGLVEREPWEAIAHVGSGVLDLALVHSWGVVPIDVPDHVDRVDVGSDVADVVMRRDHPLAGRERVSPHDLVDEGWIATFEGTICRQWLGRMYDGTGRRPRIAHEAMEFESHLALVRAGLGIALVPRLGRAPLEPDLVAVPGHDPVSNRSIVAVYRRSMAESPAVVTVVAALTRAAREFHGSAAQVR